MIFSWPRVEEQQLNLLSYSLIVFIFSLSSLASTTTKSFSIYIGQADSEAEVLSMGQKMIAEIENAKNSSANQSMRWSYCSPLNSRYIKVTSMDVKKQYLNVAGVFEPVFVGSLFFKHRSCSDQR